MARLAVAALPVWLACCAVHHDVRMGMATPAELPAPRELVAEGAGAEVCERWWGRLENPAADTVLSRAFAEAVAGAPGANALADVEIETRSVLLLVWNRSCARVHGDAVRVEPAGAMPERPPADPL